MKLRRSITINFLSYFLAGNKNSNTQKAYSMHKFSHELYNIEEMNEVRTELSSRKQSEHSTTGKWFRGRNIWIKYDLIIIGEGEVTLSYLTLVHFCLHKMCYKFLCFNLEKAKRLRTWKYGNSSLHGVSERQIPGITVQSHPIQGEGAAVTQKKTSKVKWDPV